MSNRFFGALALLLAYVVLVFVPVVIFHKRMCNCIDISNALIPLLENTSKRHYRLAQVLNNEKLDANSFLEFANCICIKHDDTVGTVADKLSEEIDKALIIGNFVFLPLLLDLELKQAFCYLYEVSEHLKSMASNNEPFFD